MTSLGDYIFSGCSNLSEVTLSNNLDTIPAYAFNGCSRIETITIPDNVEEIKESAFNSCRGLTEVNLGSGIKTIKAHAFGSCSAITTVNIGDLATWCNIEFEDGYSTPVAFSQQLLVNGEAVTTVDFPQGIGKVNNYTFQGFASLTEVNLPDDVTAIGNSAFSQCTSLQSITLPQNLETIDEMAFQSCEALTSIEIPASVKTIPHMAFYGCKGLTSVGLPEGLETIGQMAFQACSALTGISIPESVTTLEGFAFSDCTGLETISFPRRITTLPLFVCSGCSNLQEVKVYGENATIGMSAFGNCNSLKDAWINATSVTYSDFAQDVTIYVPYGSIETWSTAYENNIIRETGMIEIDGDLDYTTYYIDADFTMPEGMEGYVISGVDGDVVVKEKVYGSGDVVPNRTPLLIKSENDATAWFQVTKEDSTPYEGENLLVGSDNDDIVIKDDNLAYYKLGYDEYQTQFGFMPVLDNGAFQIEAHTAYLAVDAEIASENGYLLDETSGINSPTISNDAAPKGIYRLNGTKVDVDDINLLPNGFYIIDGEKVIINK